MSESGAYLDDVEVILFDFDGTVADSIPLLLESFRYASRTVLGAALPDELLLANVGRPLIDQMRVVAPDHADELLRVYREHNLAHHDKMISAYPDVGEVLGGLAHRGYRLGIVTSKARALADKGLEVLGLEDTFEVVVAFEDTGEHKPGGEPVGYALEVLEVPASRAAYVGDSPFDVASGRAAGVRTIGVTWGAFREDTLVGAGPDLIIRAWRELLEVLPSRCRARIECAGCASGARKG